MLKRKVAIGLSLAMTIMMLAGCSGGETKTETTAAGTTAAQTEAAKTEAAQTEAPKGEDVTITYISSTIIESPEGDFEQQCIDEFNALDNGIHVEVEGLSANDLMKKYITLATSDTMPDFFMADLKDGMTIIDMELAAEVAPILGQDYIDGFAGSELSTVTLDGAVYGLPWFANASGILYRKDIFDEKGIKIPSTWEELVDAAKALTVDGNYGITLVGTNNGSGAGRFQYVIRNFGVNEFTQDSDGKWVTDIGSQKYIDALRAYTDLDVTHHVCPPGVIETDYPTAVSLFSSGKAAMLITGSNAIGAITNQVPELKGKLGSFPIPGVERSVNTPGGFGFFISPGEHEKESAEFIKFMLDKKNALAFSQLTGRLPTRTETLEDYSIKEMPELEGFLKAKETVYEMPSIPGYSEVNDVHGQAYQSVFTGEATPEEAAAKAQKRAEEICASANEG